MQAGVALCWLVLFLFLLVIVCAILMKLNAHRCLPRWIIKYPFVRKCLYLNHVDHVRSHFVPW